jgi:hypothetical protein
MTYTRVIQIAFKLAGCGMQVVSSTCEIIIPFHKNVLSVSCSEMEVNFQEKSLEKTQNAINNLMKSMKLV